MSLYDYELVVVCGGRGEHLSAALLRAELLDAASLPGKATLLGVPVFLDELEIEVESTPLRVARLLADREPFEAMLRARFVDLVDWLWNVAELLAPLTMFIPSGSDARALTGSATSFVDLPRLLAEGVPSVAHPLVYFGEALAGGALCRPSGTIEYYDVECRPGAGCLYLFVERSGGGGEILESGALQRQLIAQLSAGG